ncbi:hypothetical protein [Streptomyces sediminimaris]|uniref:hypothetical protein n=1 Tax=Streptomyces sediminimaris TaxID=3383721 RepID=UPI00399BB3B3
MTGAFGLAAVRLERDSVLAERIGGLMADLLDGVLDELHLSAEQRAVADELVSRRLGLLREAVAGGSGL